MFRLEDHPVFPRSRLPAVPAPLGDTQRPLDVDRSRRARPGRAAVLERREQRRVTARRREQLPQAGDAFLQRFGRRESFVEIRPS